MLSVRELKHSDIDSIVRYWLGADRATLKAMGADIDKMPSREEWKKMLTEQLSLPVEKKQSYCLIWEVEGQAVGHCNVNKIVYGQEAYMHLHLWDRKIRKKGLGTELVRMSLGIFFEKLQLKNLYCEPYALNPAPNKTLKNIGFRFVKEYETTPGFLNFEQKVNLWKMSKDGLGHFYGKISLKLSH